MTKNSKIQMINYAEAREKRERNLEKRLNDVYEVDTIEGTFHYASFGPGHYTWDDWKTKPKSENFINFGNFKSLQAAKKEFAKKYPVENNYYKWKLFGHRLFRNGKPIMLIGNSAMLT
jgi:hypothetical protein